MTVDSDPVVLGLPREKAEPVSDAGRAHRFTMDELLAARTNGWGCPECGAVFHDTTKGVSIPLHRPDPACRHRVLRRGAVSVGRS